MKYDELIEELGDFGPYQKRTYVFSCIPYMAAAIQTMISVYILAVPNYRCAVPGMTNDTYAVQSDDHQRLINFTLPWTDRDPDDDTNKWGSAQCNYYDRRNASDMSWSSRDPYFNHTAPCHRWVYDRSGYDNTFVTQEDMVCEDKTLHSHANMVYMAGLLVGSLIFGLISDAFGRKKAYMIAISLLLASSVCIIFSPNFIVFVIFRFVIGMSVVGVIVTAFVLAMEPVGRKWRTVASLSANYHWSVGILLLCGIAYLIRDWKQLQLVMSCLPVPLLGLWWLVPESPRWLISKGRIEEARTILERIAKSNGKTLPEDAFDSVEETPQPRGSLLEILQSPVLALRTFLIFISWMVVTMVYYGLTLNVGSLAGSVYLNSAFSGIVDMLALTGAVVLLPRWGRKRFYCVHMVLGGTACLSMMIPAIMDSHTSPWVNIVLSNVGKFGSAGAFSTVYVYTAELYPTNLRNSMIGASSMVARIGGMIAPYITDLGLLVGGQFGTALPFVVFGGASLLVGIMALTLPETLNTTLPETIEDAINFGKEKTSPEKNTPHTTGEIIDAYKERKA